ncbi:hypothetical protein ACVWZN_002147 [Lysobacter sp. HA35]
MGKQCATLASHATRFLLPLAPADAPVATIA